MLFTSAYWIYESSASMGIVDTDTNAQIQLELSALCTVVLIWPHAPWAISIWTEIVLVDPLILQIERTTWRCVHLESSYLFCRVYLKNVFWCVCVWHDTISKWLAVTMSPPTLSPKLTSLFMSPSSRSLNSLSLKGIVGTKLDHPKSPA